MSVYCSGGVDILGGYACPGGRVGLGVPPRGGAWEVWKAGVIVPAHTPAGRGGGGSGGGARHGGEGVESIWRAGSDFSGSE